MNIDLLGPSQDDVLIRQAQLNVISSLYFLPPLPLTGLVSPLHLEREVIISLLYRGSIMVSESTKEQPRKPDVLSFPLGSVRRSIEHIALEQDIPASYLALTLSLENRSTPTSYETTRTGTYRGLGQFSRTTWRALVDMYPNADLGPYDFGSVDMERSIRAVALLYRANRITFRRHFPGLPFSDEIGYLYHQQGAGGAYSFLRTGQLRYPRQSGKSVAMFNQLFAATVGHSSSGGDLA